MCSVLALEPTRDLIKLSSLGGCFVQMPGLVSKAFPLGTVLHLSAGTASLYPLSRHRHGCTIGEIHRHVY